jgi:hypothetical protein
MFQSFPNLGCFASCSTLPKSIPDENALWILHSCSFCDDSLLLILTCCALVLVFARLKPCCVCKKFQPWPRPRPPPLSMFVRAVFSDPDSTTGFPGVAGPEETASSRLRHPCHHRHHPHRLHVRSVWPCALRACAVAPSASWSRPAAALARRRRA